MSAIENVGHLEKFARDSAALWVNDWSSGWDKVFWDNEFLPCMSYASGHPPAISQFVSQSVISIKIGNS